MAEVEEEEDPTGRWDALSILFIHGSWVVPGIGSSFKARVFPVSLLVGRKDWISETTRSRINTKHFKGKRLYSIAEGTDKKSSILRSITFRILLSEARLRLPN
jgi:hypothetical protein